MPDLMTALGDLFSHLNLVYCATVVLAAQVIKSSIKIKNPYTGKTIETKYIVLVVGILLAIPFAFIDMEYTFSDMILSYLFSNSFYSLILKKIKEKVEKSDKSL